MSAPRGPARTIRDAWERLRHRPAGPWMFSKLAGRMIPYTGTLGARVVELGPGHAVVTLRDRRKVRNHLRSVHAMALANLAEFATGLAFNYGLPDDARAIVRSFEVDYVKKARGLLTASCDCEVPADNSERECKVVGEIRDDAGDVVATATATWLVGPLRKR